MLRRGDIRCRKFLNGHSSMKEIGIIAMMLRGMSR